jgi:hypothetical protein
MPSPFPGMDPYIEDPKIWPDFHNNLAAEIQGQLNRVIQPRYVARLVPYVTYETIEISDVRGIRPDVGIWHVPAREGVIETTAVITPAPVESIVAVDIPVRLASVAVHLVGTMQLVTAIEILSPINKRPGHEAYTDYQRKRRDLLRSPAHLIELDLLRGGERMPLEKPVGPSAYVLMLSHAERRPRVSVWPLQLRDRLPVLPVPLLEPDPDVALDLGAAVAAVYERGGYASLIDYRQPPPPPNLSEAEARWLDDLLRQRGLR